jgi:hypothetical protein
MADLTDDQLDDLARVARAGSPGPFQAAFSYRDPGNVLALLAAVRRGRRIEAAAAAIFDSPYPLDEQIDKLRAALDGA